MLQVDLACFLDTSIVEAFTEMLILCVTIFIGIFYEIVSWALLALYFNISGAS